MARGERALESELQLFMGGVEEREKEESKARKEQGSELVRLYNLFHVRALENAVQMGTGKALAASSVQSGVIEVGRVEHANRVSQEGALRQCVKNSVSGAKRFELPRTFVGGIEVPRPTLHMVSDMGPKQWPSLQWLTEAYHIRGVVMGDSFHMDWNALRKALSRCDLYLLTLERCLLHNLPSGPWEGAGNHGQIRAAVDAFFSSQNSECELYTFLYDRLRRGFGDMPPDNTIANSS
eukprot:4171080-Amphidinium_carterae.3